jgi:hypothetical protein
MATLINIGNNIKVNPKFISYFEGLEIVLANKHRFTVSAEVIELVKAYVENRNTGALHYKGKVSSVSNLPSTGNIDGDMYLVTGEDKYYAWNGTSWDDTPTIVNISSLQSSLSSEVSRAQAKEAELQDAIADQNEEIADFKETITDQVNNYQPVVIEGDVTNAADEEDLTSDNGLLKIKNRSALNGKGFVILRRGSSFASQVTLPNTIYEVRYNFDLGGGSVTIPVGCTLSFVGGSISNGILTGTNTGIKASTTKIFGNNLTISGQWNYDEAYPEWFGAVGDGTTDDTDYLSLCVRAFKNVVLPQTYSITSVVVPAKTSITINKSVKSNGKGLVLNNECSVKGGIINVTSGNAGITLGDATINQNFRRRIIEGIKFYGPKTANTAAIKCEASANYYNTFDTIKDIVIYGLYYGIVGNIRASLIDAVIEQPNVGLQLNGDYLDCRIVGQSGVVADGNEYFCIISGTRNKLSAKIYDLGVNPNWQKYPCLFQGDLNEYDGGGEPITEKYNPKVNKTWWRNLHKISEPNVRVKCHNVIGSNTSMGTFYTEQLISSRFSDDLRSRYLPLYPQEGEENCYVDFTFGGVSNFLGIEMLTFGGPYGFSKMEIYDGTTLLQTVESSANGEIGYFRYSGMGDVVSNLIVRCYVTHEVRLVSGNLYATTASVIRKQITYTQADNAERKSLIKITPNNVSASSASCLLYVTNGGRFSEWYALIRCSFFGRYNLNNCGVSMEVISASTNLTTEVFKRDTGSNYELVFAIKVPNIATNNMNVEILSSTSREPCYVEYVPTNYIRESEGTYTDADDNVFLLADEKQVTKRGTTAQRPALSATSSGSQFFDTDLNQLLVWDGTSWICADGFEAGLSRHGDTASRPTLQASDAGFQYFDTDLGKPIYWTGAKWVDATGADLS